MTNERSECALAGIAQLAGLSGHQSRQLLTFKPVLGRQWWPRASSRSSACPALSGFLGMPVKGMDARSLRGQRRLRGAYVTDCRPTGLKF